jgi:PPP family 3-phenylpropionic acid transporter
MSPRGSLSLRLSLFYGAVFSVIGIQLPFWPLYLSGKGMSPAQIGQIMASAFFIKILTNPVIGHIVDKRGDRRLPLLALALVAAIASMAFAVADNFTALLVVTLVSSAAFTAMMPLGDSLTMLSAGTHRLDYGRIRLWGSLAFIATATLSGWLLVDAPRPAILWSVVAGQVLSVAAVWLLPDIRSQRAPPRQPLGALIASPAFLLFLATTSLTQVSHMIYYGFATLYWRGAGLSGGVIGALWAEGVVAEVILFAFGARLLSRFGPSQLMAAAGIAGALRWTVLALTTDPWALASVQFLHAFTFGANHLGAMHFINRAAPAGLSARAQGIYSSITMGVVPGLAMLVAGRLYEGLGGSAFLVTSVLSAAGAGLSVVLMRRWSGRVVVE